MEYNPGYTVDPRQVQVRGESAREWTVQLPEAIALPPEETLQEETPIAETPVESPEAETVATASSTSNVVRNRPVQGAQTRIQGVTTTADGFFIRTSGDPVEAEVDRFEEDGQRFISVELEDTAVALGLTAARLPSDRYSIDSWRVEQHKVIPLKPKLPMSIEKHIQYWKKTLTHAGVRDPGAVGFNGLQENQVVNDITPQVAEILRAQGVNVVLTRDRDMEVDLAPRVQIAERANATIFVSIHANAISMSRPDVNGLETFYSSAAGQRLANTVHSTVLSEMGIRDRRVRSARFYVIRQTSMPAILIETGVVTGAEDAPNLADPAWRARMASAIARGILLHLQRGV